MRRPHAREKATFAVALACLLGCSEWRLKPTFPEHAAGKPVLHEQAILGISDEGSALVAQLVSADGEGPHLSLLLYYRDGAPTRSEMVAPAEAARAVAEQVLAEGRRPSPLLRAAPRGGGGGGGRGASRSIARWACGGDPSRAARRSCTTATASPTTRREIWMRRGGNSIAPSRRTPGSSTRSTTPPRLLPSPTAPRKRWRSCAAPPRWTWRACRCWAATTTTSRSSAGAPTSAPCSA